MSFFSFLGKVGKAVGKVALAGGNIVTGGAVDQVVSVFKPAQSNATTGAPVAAATNLTSVSPTPSQPLDLNKFITLPTVNVEHGVELPSASSLPSWALPAGIGLLAVLLLGGGRRR